jgi:hypothetical protein
MQQKKFFAVIGILVAITVLSMIIQKCKNKPKESTGAAAIVTWNDLAEFDYKTGKATEKLKDLDGKKVRIAGYVVPLADEYFVLSEFLLVPNAQACIHVPPPPPNLIIHVKLEEPLPVEKVYNPAWIEGTFTIDPSDSVQGAAAFKMNDATLDEYKD